METKSILITFAPHVQRWFQDIAIAACKSFKDLGHRSNVIACNKIDAFNTEQCDIIVVLAPHAYTQLGLSPSFVKAPDKIYVGWCMEQTPHIGKSCDIMQKHWRIAQKYIGAFDFFFTESDCKTDYIIKQGIQAFTATIGYHEHFTMVKEKPVEDYDVFFVGAMFPRRAIIMQRLKELKLKVYPAPREFFDPIVKANTAARCKIGLNIHHNNVGYFEKPRIIQDYMSNMIPVVTETVDHPEGFVNGEHWYMAKYEDLADRAYEVCRQSASERRRIATNAFEYISQKYRMRDSMENMLNIVLNNWTKRIKTFTGEQNVPDASDEAIHRQHMMRYEFFQNMAIDKTILDVGCGTGYGTNLLASVSAKAIGIDIDESTIEHARNKYPLPKFGTANMLQLPYGKNTFDLIYCFEAIEHVSDYRMALFEANRVLKNGGMLIVSTPNKNIVSNGSHHPKNEFHIKEWQLDEFVSELKKYFKKVVTYGQVNHDPWNVHFEATDDDLFFICICTK